MRTIVVREKAGQSLESIIDEVMFWLGEGGRPGFSRNEEAFAFNCTPGQIDAEGRRWYRIPAVDEFIAGIEFLLGKGIQPESCEIVAIEDYQQEIVINEGVDADGNPYRELLGYIGNGNYPPVID